MLPLPSDRTQTHLERNDNIAERVEGIRNSAQEHLELPHMKLASKGLEELLGVHFQKISKLPERQRIFRT